MQITVLFFVKLATVAFLFVWGAYERVSAISKGKKHAEATDRDRNSLIIFYMTIFLGYGVGIPAAFTDHGGISAFSPYLSMSGLCVVAIGLGIRLTAIRTLAEQFTYTVKIIENHRLITSGLYEHVRHPSYLGQSLIFLGCGVAFANWLSMLFLFLPNLIAAFYRISVEEKVLRDHFPQEYAAYAARSWKMVPWVY